MKLRHAALCILLPLSASGQEPRRPTPAASEGAHQHALRLWYRQPAANWNEALPIGSGKLGAMVFGGVGEERLQLNEDTVWAGEKRDRLNPAGPDAVREVRRLLFAGKAAEAEALADKAIISTPRRMPPYQTLGDLTLRFTHAAAATDYRRELDLDEAIARVRFTIGPTSYTREVFASAVDKVIVVRIDQRPARDRFAASPPGSRRQRTRRRDAEGDADRDGGSALAADAARHPTNPGRARGSTRHVRAQRGRRPLARRRTTRLHRRRRETRSRCFVAAATNVREQRSAARAPAAGSLDRRRVQDRLDSRCARRTSPTTSASSAA